MHKYSHKKHLGFPSYFPHSNKVRNENPNLQESTENFWRGKKVFGDFVCLFPIQKHIFS